MIVYSQKMDKIDSLGQISYFDLGSWHNLCSFTDSISDPNILFSLNDKRDALYSCSVIIPYKVHTLIHCTHIQDANCTAL